MEILKISSLVIMLFFKFEEVATSVVFLACYGCFGTQQASWSYSGATGPSNWASLDAAYSACSSTSQSPVDITSASTDTSLGGFTLTGFDTTTGTHTVENTGHSLKVTIDASVTITVSGGSLPATYRVNQYHFHWGSVNTQGSEHTVNGVKYPMEVHIVTYNSDSYANIAAAQAQSQGLAVLGFFFEIDTADNANYAPLLAKFSSIANSGQTTTLTSFDLNKLVPTGFDGNSPYYRYSGSLTTPACYESVIWTVFSSTVKISSSQLATFRTLFSDAGSTTLQDNYRPVQSLNTRTIKYSGSSINQSAQLLVTMMSILAVVSRY